MNFKRIGRLLVCLVLICALLINVSPIKAKAVATEAVLIAVAAPFVISSILIGLGLLPKPSAPDFFNDIVEAAESALTSAGYVISGMFQILSFPEGFRYGVGEEVVEFLRNWVFKQGYVTEFGTSQVGGSTTSLCNGLKVTTTGQYAVFRYNYISGSPQKRTYCEAIYVSGNHGLYNADTGASIDLYSLPVNGQNVHYYLISTSTSEPDSLYPGISSGSLDLGLVEYGNFGYAKTAFATVFQRYLEGDLPGSFVANGLLLASVAALQIPLAVGYPEWKTKQVEEEEKQIQVYPLGLGQTLDETLSYTQEQTWLGQSTYQAVVQDQVQDQTLLQKIGLWFGQVLEALISIPATILDGLTQILVNALTLLFVPSQDFLQLKLQGLVQKFGYLEPIISLGDTFKVYLTGVNPTPPVIWVDLGASAWYSLGGRVKFIDLTWYAQYKPTADGIMGAFLWLWFLWRLFQSAPGIVSGASGLFGHPDSHPDASFHGSTMIPGQRFLGAGNGVKRNE